MGVGTTLIPTLQMKTKEVKRLAQGRTLAEAVFKPQPFDLSPQAPTLYLIASQIKKKIFLFGFLPDLCEPGPIISSRRASVSSSVK